jgi:signal transduction histidine kinase
MAARQAPDAVNTRWVFAIYAIAILPAALYLYAWPNQLPPQILEKLQLESIPSDGYWSVTRIIASVVAFAGCCAIGGARLQDPIARQRMLHWFAIAHLLCGAMFFIQWLAIYDTVFPPLVGWLPLMVGGLLWHLAFTAAALPPLGSGLIDYFDRERRPTEALRSQYEEQIRQAARQEERARLARELHDAVKQQLFVVQTAAATVQARFDEDRNGARAALEQVRSAARDAATEMDAMLDQLQAAPLSTAGLVEALKKQSEALRFRTGADVQMRIGELPPNEALFPGTQQAIFRVAQEALSNVARHARAQHVCVTLDVERHRLRLAITDDGAGFERMDGSTGMGTQNMHARARELGGTVSVSSTRNGGTAVTLLVPFELQHHLRYAWQAVAWGALTALALPIALGRNASTINPPLLYVGIVTLLMTVRALVAWARTQRWPRRVFGIQHAGNSSR